MSKKVEKTEKVTLNYRNDKITVKGNSIQAEMKIDSNQLYKMYMGDQGQATITVRLETEDEPVSQTTTEIVTVLDKKQVSINDYIAELASKGLSEDDIMNTKISV